MRQYLKKMLGLDKIEKNIAESEALKKEAELALETAKKAVASLEAPQEAARISNLSPKDAATERKEPWVAVLETHVNKDNVRNGFFDLDWNEYFIVQLRSAGYSGNTDEEIVDQWFQDLCQNIGAEAGVNMERRGSGFVNRALRDDGMTEVS